MAKKVIITTDKKGNTVVDVTGAVGNECEEITRTVIARMGGAESTELKPEYHETREGETQHQTA